VVEEGFWGTWQTPAKGPEGSYLCGFSYSEDNASGVNKLGMDGMTAIFCDS
jgi:hypothetical protein